MTFKEAMRRQVRFLRRPIWTSDYLELPLLPDGNYGAFATIHSPAFAEISTIPGNEDMSDLIAQEVFMGEFSKDDCTDYEEFVPIIAPNPKRDTEGE